MPCSFCGTVGHNRRTCQRFDLLLAAAATEEDTNVETEDTLPHEPLDIRNLNGNIINKEVDGLHARVVQHEFDHLMGILYISRLVDRNAFGFEDEIKEYWKEKN